MNKKTYFITGGGTGGHIYPAVAVADGDFTCPLDAYIAKGKDACYAGLPLKATFKDGDKVVSLDATSGFTSKVYIGVKGDTNLDGTVAAEDAQNALMYYINWLANKGPKAAIESNVYLNNQDDPMAMLTKSHYAADASDGNGGISAEDAQTILMYYTNNLANKGYNWDQVVGTPTEPVPVIPKEELHSDPLKYDTRAKDEYLEYKNAQ